MGYPITRREQVKKVTKGEAASAGGTGGAPTKAEKGPGWLQKYRARIEKGEITVDEILEEENKIRSVPIKRSSVTRALNAMGYPITRREQVKRVTEGEAEAKPRKAGKAEAVEYSSSIGKISESTLKQFNAVKKSWEEELGKPLHNDYFVNLLLALARLAEHGKSVVPVKR
jgi:hypothetical protein